MIWLCCPARSAIQKWMRTHTRLWSSRLWRGPTLRGEPGTPRVLLTTDAANSCQPKHFQSFCFNCHAPSSLATLIYNWISRKISTNKEAAIVSLVRLSQLYHCYIDKYPNHICIYSIIIIMLIFKCLSLEALSTLQDHEGGRGQGNKIITRMFLSDST